jgi:hypothetical protein
MLVREYTYDNISCNHWCDICGIYPDTINMDFCLVVILNGILDFAN